MIQPLTAVNRATHCLHTLLSRQSLYVQSVHHVHFPVFNLMRLLRLERHLYTTREREGKEEERKGGREEEGSMKTQKP